MSENKLPESLSWFDGKEVQEKKEEIFFIYQELYKKLDGVSDFAKRLSYVTDAIEEIFCLINNEQLTISKVKVSKNVKKVKRWKRNKQR